MSNRERVTVIANREPYAHEWGADGSVVVQRPASGLVTGIEPILRACGGNWIAYGGGSADRAHSDRLGRVAVPPEAGGEVAGAAGTSDPPSWSSTPSLWPAGGWRSRMSSGCAP